MIKYRTDRIAMFSIMIGNSLIVQKNGTLLKKPRNSGGSPTGVRHPPMLATMKMKKIIV